MHLKWVSLVINAVHMWVNHHQWRECALSDLSWEGENIRNLSMDCSQMYLSSALICL